MTTKETQLADHFFEILTGKNARSCNNCVQWETCELRIDVYAAMKKHYGKDKINVNISDAGGAPSYVVNALAFACHQYKKE